ncbi:MAG: hypothetical protein WA828_06280 [Coleofasciculaceae cyanobacterium]
MSNLIYLNSCILGVVAIVGSVSEVQAMTPTATSSPAQHLVADLPTSLPPPNLLRNSRTRVTVPPLNRPEAISAPANKKPGNLPRQTPSVQTIPARDKTTLTNSEAPAVIEFGQPLPQRRS